MAIGTRKTRVGRVVKNRMDKTVVVAVEWRQAHPLYHKKVKRITRFHVHDEENQCSVGDLVTIAETRPLSKTKRWRVANILGGGSLPDPGAILDMTTEESDTGDAPLEEEAMAEEEQA